MPSRLIVVVGAAAVALASTLAAQQQDKPQLPKSQIPDLGRPTKVTDEQPLFSFEEYFPGKWNFEWDVPEGVLGPSGTVKGSIVYKKIEGPFFDATTTATAPSGALTITELIAYRREGKTASRYITDSRGFSYQQIAPVGGDLGGYFNLYYEGSPFAYKGRTVRIKNALRLTSPLRYRNSVTVSVDGGPFTNYGSAWYEKDATATRSR
ncbi:MAG: hypothetical protein AUI11_10400 [Acidobacteria bacterium 13_2_20CM_2_66_4]|nr:MAG: hypothetical protein AUI11_10400 [Acidobacteria bacterium 13_2_20CM_2_66_4]